MLDFRSIDESNFIAVLAMKQPPEQDFVAPNAVSLAEAWLYRDTRSVYPFAVYDGDALIGFMMLDADYGKRTLDLWRFMIAPAAQNRGYGARALEKLIGLARESDRFDRMELSFEPGNAAGEHVYRKLGFTPTGEIDDGEIVMQLTL